jgi:hypothetical protein
MWHFVSDRRYERTKRFVASAVRQTLRLVVKARAWNICPKPESGAQQGVSQAHNSGRVRRTNGRFTLRTSAPDFRRPVIDALGRDRILRHDKLS